MEGSLLDEREDLRVSVRTSLHLCDASHQLLPHLISNFYRGRQGHRGGDGDKSQRPDEFHHD